MILWHPEKTKLFVNSYKKLSSQLQKQTEKVLRKIGLDMPEKSKYTIRDGLYFDFCATRGEIV